MLTVHLVRLVQVLLDLESGKVLGGDSTKFCKKLLDGAKKLDSVHAEQFIRNKIQKLFTYTNQIIDMVNANAATSEKIDKLAEELEIEELDCIEHYLGLKHQELSEALAPLLTDCRKRMSKILSGFQKQRW